MTVWIFQANPKTFDIDGFLATRPTTMLYLAKQKAGAMAVGDTVFLWRAIGSGPKELSGVVAEATIVELPDAKPEDPNALKFWSDPMSANVAPRVKLQLDRIELRDRLKRDWLTDDPILRDMRLFRMGAETNFPLSSAEGRRLRNVWCRAKVPWDYADTIAGLWAFAKTRSQTISVLPGSPVAIAALRTGRVVRAGMKNKVWNFVSLDPSDARTGFTNANALDRAAWKTYYDASTDALDVEAIEAEFKRVWPEDGLPDIASPSDDLDAVEGFSSETLVALMARWQAKAKAAGFGPEGTRPKVMRTVSSTFVRDPLIVAIALKRANGKCEVPGCMHPLFENDAGHFFLEVHHIYPLRDGGVDAPQNVAAICPAHHRETHFGKKASDLSAILRQVRLSDASHTGKTNTN